MDFPLFPWDRKRPHQNIPQAQNTLEYGGKIYGLRAQNGLLFLREAGQLKTLAVATPLEPQQENEVESFPAIARNALGNGAIARYVVGYDDYLDRTLPLFFRADGTGFCRESWNRDDLPFEHQALAHEWMEGADEVLASYTAAIANQYLHSQLAVLETYHRHELEWICGSLGQLETLVRWICWMETDVWHLGSVLEVDVCSESEFGRAHFQGWDLRGTDNSDYWYSVEVDAISDQLAVYSDNKLALTQRALQLFDLALDENTPTSLGWEYHDYGAGRCANSPQAEIISFEVARPTAHEIVEARALLRDWLHGKIPALEIESLLNNGAPAVLPKVD